MRQKTGIKKSAAIRLARYTRNRYFFSGEGVGGGKWCVQFSLNEDDEDDVDSIVS